MRSIPSAISFAGLLLIINANTVGAAPRLENRDADFDDPVATLADQMLPRNEFVLDSSRDLELVRFKRMHDIELCAAQPDAHDVAAAAHGYPIQAQWDSDTAIIAPGNCLTFDAQRVKVKAASSLPENVVLTGTIRILR